MRGRPVPIHYEVEGEPGATVGVARLRLGAKLARTLVDEELPTLDRPVRLMVTRGQRGAVRADTLAELQELLDRPWSPEEEGAAAGARGDGDGRGARRPRGDRERTHRGQRREGQGARQARGGRDGGGRDGGGRESRGSGGAADQRRGRKRGR